MSLLDESFLIQSYFFLLALPVKKTLYAWRQDGSYPQPIDGGRMSAERTSVSSSAFHA
jgi:hypothetical protein